MLICKMPPRRIAIQEPSCLGGTELLPEQPQLLQFVVKPQTWGEINSFSLTIRGEKKKKKGHVGRLCGCQGSGCAVAHN